MVKEYNEKRVSRNTLMAPNDAAKKENQTKVKTQLESIRKSDNPQPRIVDGGQGQGRSQKEVREGIHAGLER